MSNLQEQLELTEDDIRPLMPPAPMYCDGCSQAYYFVDQLDENGLCDGCWDEQTQEIPYTRNDLLGAA